MKKKDAAKLAQGKTGKILSKIFDPPEVKTKEEVEIEKWEEQKNSPEFQKKLEKVRIESNLLQTASSLKISIPKFKEENIPEAVRTKDVGLIQDAFTLYLGGYTNKAAAEILHVPEVTLTTIKNAYNFEKKKQEYTDRVLQKTTEALEKESINKTLKVLPMMAPLVEDMTEMMKKYLRSPEEYDIKHETIFKQALEWIKTYGKATGELNDNVQVTISQNQVYEKILEMDSQNINTDNFKAELIEEPKLIE